MKITRYNSVLKKWHFAEAFFLCFSTCLAGYRAFLLLIPVIFGMFVFPVSGFPLGKKTADKSATDVQNHQALFDSLFQKGVSIFLSNPDSSQVIARKALMLVEDEDSPEHIKALNLIGAGYNAQSNFIQALDVYKEALEIAVRIGDTGRIAVIYNNVGIANMKIGNYSEAMDYLLKSSNYYDEVKQELPRLRAISNIGLLYMEIENYEKAMAHYKQAYYGYLKHNESAPVANVLTNIGILFSKTNQPDSAFYYLDTAIAINLKTQHYYGLSVVYEGKATIYLEQKIFDKAVEYFEKSLEVAEKIGHTYQKTMALIGLASAYLEVGKSNQALKYAERAMDIAEESHNERLIMEIHRTFSEIFKKRKEFEKAFEHYQTYIEKEKGLVNQTKLHQIYNLEIEYLNQTKAIQQLRIEQQALNISKKNNIIVFIVIAFILIMVGVYLFYLNNNHRREAAHQKDILNLKEKKSRAAIEAELEERQRIGKELHDGLGQMLSTIRLNISALQQKAFLSETRKNELIEFSLQSVDKAFFELRDISHNLVPSALTEKGLTGALADLANQINQSKRLKLNFEAYGMNGPFDPLVENTIYRAAQELLTNAIKHAKATFFSIQLIKSKTEITCMVEDNGIGFSMENTLVLPGGGLSNIKSRVENLNGQLLIDAMQNRGTIVTIVIPVKNSENGNRAD